MEKIDKKLINQFNLNRSRDLFKFILEKYSIKNTKCKYCNDVIYYYNSTFRINNDNIYVDKKSYLSIKNLLGMDYNLCVCEDCLTKKFPEYQSLNKSRIFNRICDITCYAFGIPEDISTKWKKLNYAITLENLIIKHGEKTGTIKWNNYCKKQTETNTFEYKKEKYGWDEKKFKEYNRSRAVTIENLIKKHGEDKGVIIWNNYCDRQKYTCSLNYFKNEYGDFEGTIKYLNFAEKRAMNGGYSNISQVLFNELKIKLKNKYTLYYATHNKEYSIINEQLNTYYNLDFFIKELNLSIEFNGDAWHCNPKIYNEKDKPLSFLGIENQEYCAKIIWEKDKKRLDFLKTKLIDVIIIWERDLIDNGLDNIIKNLLKKIKTYEK